jgi:hypothetical protein
MTCFIGHHINRYAGDKPFSIRDCLIYGPRSLVDQVFHKFVKQGLIVRLARGVYIKSSAPTPTIEEIIQVKAAAFGRMIATHGSQAPAKLNASFKNDNKLIYACSGPTSSFRVGDLTVQFIRTNSRKMKLGDSKVGLAIRALWHLGKDAWNHETAALLLLSFKRIERKQLCLSVRLMPQWMRDCLAELQRMTCFIWDREAILVQ